MPLLGDWGRIMTDLAKAQELGSYLDGHNVLRDAAAHGVEMAQAKMGHYQPGWDPLAPATVEARVRAGYTPDDPLLRSGGLRDAIRTFGDTGTEISFGIAEGDEHFAQGMTQEHGSISGNVSPRPFIEPTAVELMPELEKSVHVAVGDLFGG